MIVPGLDSFEDLLLSMKDRYEKLNKECEALRETLNTYNEEDEIRKRDEWIQELEKRALAVFTEKRVQRGQRISGGALDFLQELQRLYLSNFWDRIW